MIQNKFEKFMLFLSSFFLVVLGTAALKLREDDKKMNDLGNMFSDYNASMAAVLETQKQIMAQRQSTLDKIEAAPAPDTTKTITTQTVIPGKVVEQKIPVASSGSSSKTTKTS